MKVTLAGVAAIIAIMATVWSQGWRPVLANEFAELVEIVQRIEISLAAVTCRELCEETCKRNGIPLDRCDCSLCPAWGREP